MPRYAPLVTAATCLAAAATSATGQTADDVMSVRQGVYTDEQAQRGESMYEQACSQCHPSDYFNQRVLPSWVGAPVSMLFDVMSTTMPEDRPSSLKPEEYAAVLAYIFKLNGLPSGRRALPAEPALLERIVIEGPPQ